MSGGRHPFRGRPLKRRPSGAAEWLRAAAGATVLLTACRTTTSPRAAEPARASLSGTATYEAVIEPSANTAKQVSQRLFLPAAPGDENHPPVYPEELVDLALPPQRVVVRLDLDERGHVTTVTPNDGASEADPRYRAAFETAIRIAVDRWCFRPATQRAFVDSPDDGSGKPPYKMLKAETPVPTYFDIRFIFEVMDGRGVVRQVP